MYSAYSVVSTFLNPVNPEILSKISSSQSLCLRLCVNLRFKPLGAHSTLWHNSPLQTDLTMKPLRFLASALLLALLSFSLVHSSAQATNTNSTTIIGQWDFNTANLAEATIGSPLRFIGFTALATNDVIGNQSVGVMSITNQSLTSAQRLLATFAPTNNGGGNNLNQYTIIMDLKWPAESAGLWRALFNANTNNNDDAELFVERDGQVGIFNDYVGTMNPTEWYRLVLVFDLATNQMVRYLNGVNPLGTNTSSLPRPEGNVDGQFSLNDAILFFSDNDGETAPVIVNVIQLRAGAMTREEVAALGGPASGNLGGGTIIPVGDFRIDSITRNGSTFTITVDNDGRSIRLQRTTDLANPNSWTEVAGPQTSSTFTVANDAPYAFFRVASP